MRCSVLSLCHRAPRPFTAPSAHSTSLPLPPTRFWDFLRCHTTRSGCRDAGSLAAWCKAGRQRFDSALIPANARDFGEQASLLRRVLALSLLRHGTRGQKEACSCPIPSMLHLTRYLSKCWVRPGKSSCRAGLFHLERAALRLHAHSHHPVWLQPSFTASSSRNQACLAQLVVLGIFKNFWQPVFVVQPLSCQNG